MDRESRRKIFIDPSFQLNFIGKFCLVVMASSVLIASSVFLLTRESTTVMIENTKVLVKPTSDFILPSLLMTVLIVAVFSALTVFVIALFVSHKIAGPLYRLRREIDLMQKGDLDRNFNIRNKDQIQALAKSLSSMNDIFRSKHTELRETYQALVTYLEKKDFRISAQDKEELQKILNEMNKTMGYFKV
ncbi:MAG: hypothetical protein ABIJ41_06155 [Candidatus Omnitrophota bacterium]